MSSSRAVGFFLFVAASGILGADYQAAAQIRWSPAIEVASGGGQRGEWRQNDSKYDYVDDPSVALDASGRAALVWVDQRRKDVFFQSYERNGKPRLQTPVNVSRTPSVFSWLPRIALSPANPLEVFVLWQEIVFSGGSHGGDILFASSRDGGRSFTAPINLSNSPAGDGKGRIDKDHWHNGSLDLVIGADGAVCVAWTEYEGVLWFRRSADGGQSFSQPLRIAGGGRDKPARAPALASGRDKTLYIAWTVGEDPSADIHIARSTDGGATFNEPTIVARTPGYSDAPKIAIDSKGILHLVHAESRGGPFDAFHIRHASSRDGGRTFETPREISLPNPAGVESAAFPSLAIDGQDTLYVLWELYPNRREAPRGLAMVHSADAGQSFTRPALVPGSTDPHGGFNGSQQGLLMRKLAVSRAGEIAVVNSSLKYGAKSRVWLLRARPDS